MCLNLKIKLRHTVQSLSPMFKMFNVRTNRYCFYRLSFQIITDLFPLGNEEDEHYKDFLKHHDKDVEDTLAQPRCALHRLS